MQVIELGVHDFLNLALKSGGLSSEFCARNRAAVGTSAHGEVATRRPQGYQREVPVRHIFDWHGFRLIVRGRIDGLQKDGDTTILEEIKSTYIPLEDIDPERFPHHLAQLQLYHHFYIQHSAAERIVPTLTYVNLSTMEERSFTLEWTPEESQEFFEDLAIRLLQREAEKRRWQAIRDKSLKTLPFPYPHLRPGQTELIGAVEQAITGHRDALVEAATGIGKTMGVLYPALCHLATRKGHDRIFFLTAKTAGVEVVRNTIAAFRAQGMRLRVLYLQAKERSCPFAKAERPDCDERFCPFAEDFYDKVDRVAPALLDAEEMTPEFIDEIARREMLCPFELALELSLDADLIVCDYNYAFDPAVYLRRFFSPGLPANNLFLVDEAHNLVPRSREMYSATLSEDTLRVIKETAGTQSRGLTQSLILLAQQFSRWVETMEWEGAAALRLEELSSDLRDGVEGVLDNLGEMLATMPRSPRRRRLLECYFEVNHFSRITEGLTREYAIFVGAERRGALKLRLFCLHPGPLLRPRLERSASTIFFSATLSPAHYFRDLCGARDGCIHLSLPSPFPPENRLYLHVPEVSTKYTRREETKPSVAQVILNVARARRGNYLAFFPSYAYQGAVWAEMMMVPHDDMKIHVQRPGMTPAQQTEFLQKVCTPADTHANIGLAVMGGLFGEAIDLPGEQLIGAIIVGPGLPGLSQEQELIAEFFENERDGQGLFYAFQVPGMIRVIQAAGRVFRTPQDKGVVVLIDDRFCEEPFRTLLPVDWGAQEAEFSTPDYQASLREFWGRE